MAIVTVPTMATDAMPIHPVALIAFGYGTEAGKIFATRREDDAIGVVALDVRDRLKDRVQGFQVSSDGDSGQTQMAIYAQPAFVGLVEDLVGLICRMRLCNYPCDGRKQIIGVGCTKGKHRAWVTLRAVQSVLNQMKRASGDRVFNAQFFPLSSGSEKRAAQWERQVYDSASEWLAKPWFTVADDPFAFSVCMQNKTCAAAWHRIALLVAKYTLFLEE